MAMDTEPLAFHLYGKKVNPAARGKGEACGLPDELVIPPGTYSVHGTKWHLGCEGLYRFLQPGCCNHQRIVYSADPFALLSGLSWIASHGSRDNGKGFCDLKQMARRGKAILTCKNTACLGEAVCECHGVEVRRVSSRTLENPNGYNDGHELLEVNFDGRWTLVDLDMKYLFLGDNGRLSLLEFAAASQNGRYSFEALASATRVAVGHWCENGYDYGLWGETIFSTECQLRSWYRRIMMVPVIPNGGVNYSTASTCAQAGRAREMYPDLKLEFLPVKEFGAKFYPTERPSA